MKKILEIFTDGGSRGNPGDSSGGIVFVLEGKVIFQSKIFFGQMTNNMVEYLAFINACVFLIEKSKNFKKKIRKVVFFLDSLLVVNQLNFVWLIKDEKMKFLATNASVLLKKLPFEFCIKHIGREKNTKADDLVNQVLDLIKSS